MRAVGFLLLSGFIACGCASQQPAVIAQQSGVRTITIVPNLFSEGYPLEEWRSRQESVLDRLKPDQIARNAAFHARKRKEWEEFLALSRSNEDRVFRVAGSTPGTPEVFDYYALVRSGREIKRYYVAGGDGIYSIE